MASGKTVIGKPRESRFTGRPLVGMATPIRNAAGEIVGILAAYAPLSDKSLFAQVENSMTGKTGAILVIDPRNRLIVSSSRPDDILLSISNAETSLDPALRGMEGSRISHSLNGMKVLTTTKMIKSAAWTVQIELPAEEAFMPIQRVDGVVYGITFALTLLALGSVLFLVRRALKPLEDVTSAIQKMALADGKIHHLPVSGDKEIADLADSFNTLAHRRIHSEKALRQSEAHFRTVIEASPIPYVFYDKNQNVTYLNPAFIKTIGYTLEDIPTLHDLSHKAFPDPAYQEWISTSWSERIEQSHRENQPFSPIEVDMRCKNNEVRTVLAAAERLAESSSGLRVVSLFDITDLKRTEESLRLAATVFSHAREGILITEPDGTILDVNDMFCEITGYSREEVIGCRPNVFSSGKHDKDFYRRLWRELEANGYWTGEIWNRRKNGEIFPETLTISAVRDSQDKTQQYVALFSDISEAKAHELRLQEMAHYDPLTHLPNRTLLSDRLQQAMSQAIRGRQRLAVCYLDLDGFKQVNDSYGHDVGDQLLVAVTECMKRALRESDTLARIGGDEFVCARRRDFGPNGGVKRGQPVG